MRETFERVFSALNQDGVAWCMLPQERSSGDADNDALILVRPEDVRAAERVLGLRGFLTIPGSTLGSHRLYFNYLRSEHRWLKLALVTRLSFGAHTRINTFAATECLSRRRQDGNVVLPNQDDEFWILLWRHLFDSGFESNQHLEHIVQLVDEAQTDGPLARRLDEILPQAWDCVRVIESVRGQEWQSLDNLSSALIASQGKANRGRRPWLGLDRTRHIIRHGTRRRGVSVALLGPDGAGKSTLAATMQQTFCLPTHMIYMGVQAMPPTRIGPVAIPGSVLAKRLGGIWSSYLSSTYHRSRGRLVIFDRYTYDFLLPMNRQLSPHARLYYWILSRSCPGPDLVLILDVPGAVMFQRKGERSPEVLEGLRQELLALQKVLPNVETVDATNDADTVRSEVSHRVWQLFTDRWAG